MRLAVRAAARAIISGLFIACLSTAQTQETSRLDDGRTPEVRQSAPRADSLTPDSLSDDAGRSGRPAQSDPPSGAEASHPSAPIRETLQGTILTAHDVEYAVAEGESLKLDLYRPDPEHWDHSSLHPGIVFIHGGGWTGGDKREFSTHAWEMAERGYVAITVNYRIAPRYRYPAAVDDVQTAVRWLRSHATEFDVDPGRIASLGASAGGHLAAMLGVIDTRAAIVEPGMPSSRVDCVVDYFGRMDLPLEQTGKFTDFRPAFIGRHKSEDLALYEDASPINHVDSHTPPFLMIHGAHDTQVDPVQSLHMLDALQKAHIEASLILLGNAGHGFGGVPGDTAWDTAKAFLDRHLHPPHPGSHANRSGNSPREHIAG